MNDDSSLATRPTSGVSHRTPARMPLPHSRWQLPPLCERTSRMSPSGPRPPSEPGSGGGPGGTAGGLQMSLNGYGMNVGRKRFCVRKGGARNSSAHCVLGDYLIENSPVTHSRQKAGRWMLPYTQYYLWPALSLIYLQARCMSGSKDKGPTQRPRAFANRTLGHTLNPIASLLLPLSSRWAGVD